MQGPRPPCSHGCQLLHLLGAPAGIRLAHVGRGLDGRDKLENDIGNTDEADDGAGNDPEDGSVEEDAANKDVDCAGTVSAHHSTTGDGATASRNIQIPRPMNENMNEA